AESLDALDVQELRPDEQITFSSFQGRVNRTQPRFILLDERAGEGRDTWLETETTGLGKFKVIDADDRYKLIAEHASEFKGVVLYDISRSEHYRNLAGT